MLVLTESKLDETFPSTQFKIDGFKPPYRNDLNKYAGRVMIYVREDLACKQLHVMNNSGEGIFLELNLRKVKWLLFGGYNHKKSNIIFFLKELGPLLDHYIAKFDHFLILGDFNSEITEDDMSEFCDIYHLKNLINEPTCYKNIHNPSNIDVMLTNKSRNIQHSQTIQTSIK